ncbi:MAG: hypothetical protein PUB21_06410 [Bacteroidales bacterium]|nr:hypothetical protein [Bacteroidales bacterium]
MCIFGMSCCSCERNLIEYGKGDIRVSVEQGEGWLHDFPLFLGISKKNPPQIAIWLEDMEGNYLSTVYVSHKIATQTWQAAGGNRRKEALPHWCYCRGVQYSDGLYLPTKKEPFTDGISGATPHSGFNVKVKPIGNIMQFVVKVEINHSTDFNDFYPKSAQPGEAGYSGGKLGSGQPALVYEAKVDLTSPAREYTTVLIGHSSPDGSDGAVYSDVSAITTALDIVKRISVNIQ